jgi:metal-responsive CopG/Arc/MetJ family transcriptional regulator
MTTKLITKNKSRNYRRVNKKKVKLQRITFNMPKPIMDEFDKVCEKEFIFMRTDAMRLAITEFIQKRLK